MAYLCQIARSEVISFTQMEYPNHEGRKQHPLDLNSPRSAIPMETGVELWTSKYEARGGFIFLSKPDRPWDIDLKRGL